VLRELGRFRWRGAGFEAWLFRIAANLAVDHLRKHGREVAHEEVAGYLDGADAATPEGRVLLDEQGAELMAVLDTLPPDQREILLLRFGAGLGTDEAARAMGRNANAVRQLQFRALSNMRDRMRQDAQT
jgi:RNA polymerase sigma-70 factor (ECF subfamily)